jgi:hypothetical protein
MPTKNPQKEILYEIPEKLMEKILNMFNQNLKDALKNFKTPKIKNVRRYRNK